MESKHKIYSFKQTDSVFKNRAGISRNIDNIDPLNNKSNIFTKNDAMKLAEHTLIDDKKISFKDLETIIEKIKSFNDLAHAAKALDIVLTEINRNQPDSIKRQNSVKALFMMHNASKTLIKENFNVDWKEKLRTYWKSALELFISQGKAGIITDEEANKLAQLAFDKSGKNHSKEIKSIIRKASVFKDMGKVHMALNKELKSRFTWTNKSENLNNLKIALKIIDKVGQQIVNRHLPKNPKELKTYMELFQSINHN